MRKVCGAVFSVLVLIGTALAAQETIRLWPDLAPGETQKIRVEQNAGAISELTDPVLLVFRPENKTSDAAVVIFPGGGYDVCYYGNEGIPNARWWNERGVTAFVLLYRVPRQAGRPICERARQDAMRGVRIVRSRAGEFGIDPEKIGAEGYSAGGNLTLQAAVNSQTPAYEPIDEIDQTPCHLNFAIAVYPAYVLDDGAIGPNEHQGEGALMLETLTFDAKTPPICLIHGDADIYSPLGSIEVYRRLRTLGIKAELHIYTGAPHGFMFWDDLPNARSWHDRSCDWIQALGIY